MLYVKKDQLSEGQQKVAALVERIEAADVFDPTTQIRRQGYEFSKNKALPFLGRTGIIECVELFALSGIPSIAEDDAMGSLSVSRHLRQVKGCPNGVYATSQYVVMERIDGNGIKRIGVDPFMLSTHGTYEQFVIFGDNTVSRYGDELSLKVADELLTAFVQLRPVPTDAA